MLTYTCLWHGKQGSTSIFGTTSSFCSGARSLSGSGDAARLFQKLMMEAIRPLRRSIRMAVYLDDMIVLGESNKMLGEHVEGSQETPIFGLRHHHQVQVGT